MKKKSLEKYARPNVVFNLSNPHHKELYDWVMRETTNFSDYVRAMLAVQKQSRTKGISYSEVVKEKEIPEEYSDSDKEAMKGLL